MLTARSLAGRRFYTKLYTAEAVATGGRVGKVRTHLPWCLC